jgi:hypothetical protein
MPTIEWNNANFNWDLSGHYWNLVEVIEEIVSGGKNWKERDKDKKKRRKVIRLLMWRKGVKVYDEEKEIENIELHIDDIKIMAEEIKKNVQIIHG